MNEQVSLSTGQRIATLRQFFRSRRADARDPHFNGYTSGSSARPGASMQAWQPTEWPETQWSDTCFDPPALDAR